MEENIDVDEDVDIEGEFLIETDQLREESIVKADHDVVNGNRWVRQALDNDMDSESKETILKMLECDEAVLNSHHVSTMSACKTTEAMKKTSRRQLWSHEDKALFETGVEIYGRSWKDIAELLPHKSLSQVTSYGIQYFRKNIGVVLVSGGHKQQHAALKQSSANPVVQSTPVHPLISNAQVHRLEECESDEEVDIMSDGSEQEPANHHSTTSTVSKAEFNSVSSPGAREGSLLSTNSVSSPGELEGSLFSTNCDDELGSSSCKSPSLVNSVTVCTKLTSEFVPSASTAAPLSVVTTIVGESLPEGKSIAYATAGVMENMLDSIVPDIERTDSTGTGNAADDTISGTENGAGDAIAGTSNAADDSITDTGSTANNIIADTRNAASETVAGAEGVVDDKLSIDKAGALEYYTPAELRLDYGVLNSNGELVAMCAPTSQSTLDRDSISDQEKQVHFEFFENRVNKTPERYLRIRNYILDQWSLVKPKYLNKTSIRTGLKQCGDVNCIGRIHAYLEQLGAINFGCALNNASYLNTHCLSHSLIVGNEAAGSMLSQLLDAFTIGDNHKPITKRSPWTLVNNNNKSANATARSISSCKTSAPINRVKSVSKKTAALAKSRLKTNNIVQAKSAEVSAAQKTATISTSSSVSNISLPDDSIRSRDNSWCSLWLGSRVECHTPTLSFSSLSSSSSDEMRGGVAVYLRMALSGGVPSKSKPLQEQTTPYADRTRKRRPTAARNVHSGGSTYEHGSDEDMPSPPSKTLKTNSSKANLDSFALISCADFVHCDMSCPYKVVIESTAAAVMDIHSHLCKTEVIGLLGGLYNSEQESLCVLRAEPCWSKSTSLHCDMDPVSQTQAGEMIRQAGLQVIGWYHSHPTFVPNPSQQDIESQEIFQKWFSKGGKHFLGVIVSPYNPANKTHNSEIRCFTTAPTPAKLVSYYRTASIPLKFDYKVETSANNTEIIDLVPKISRLLEMYKNYQHTVDLLDTYNSSNDLTSLDKMLLSVQSYLQTTDEKVLDKSLLLEDLRFVLTCYSESTAAFK